MMHEFKRRMLELFQELPDMNRGRRLRLLSPIRQAPLVCWEPLGDDSLEEVLKASMRAAVHELIDEYCCHLAGALARCDSPELKTLVAALSAFLIASRVSVQFRDGPTLSGFLLPYSERAIIEPAAIATGRRFDLVLERHCHSPCAKAESMANTVRRAGVIIGDDRPSTVAGQQGGNAIEITLSPEAVRRDPFRRAAELWRAL
jgi:hypothetical protein